MNDIVSINPATLEEIGRVPVTSEQKVKEYVSKAKAVHPSWSRLPVKERAKYILKAREYLLGHMDDFALTITRDNGKPLTESISAEIYPVADLLWWAAHNTEKILRPHGFGIGIFNLMLRSSYIEHQPLGVVGIISPWNYPFSIPVGTAAMALMAGNCVVLKPSSVTPLVGKKIEEMFAASGLPEFVFTCVQGGAATGEALLDTSLAKLVFTGSVDVGRHVAETCARKLIPCISELGGKDAAIIRADADLEHASSGVVWGAFTNTGQCCASIERVYVHESIAEKFIGLVVEKTKKLRVGNGEDPNTDIGPMTTLAQLQIVEAHVEEAGRRGAKILCGGKRVEPLILSLPALPGRPGSKDKQHALRQAQSERTVQPGYFFEPTVITGIDHTFACVTEETFGPLLPIMTFKDDMQAIRLANDSEYGLNAYIWTGDISTGRQMASLLRSGTTVINDAVYTHAIPQTPWGGIKYSGSGRTHGAWGFYELTNLHHVHINRTTLIKDFWWYPYGEALTSTLKGLSSTLTGNIISRLRGIPGLVRALTYKKY